MKATQDEIQRLFGDISDSLTAEIIQSGATIAELEEVAAHLAQETDVMAELEKPLTGRALRIFTMLDREAEKWQEE